MHYVASAFIFNKAQEIRRNMTPTEDILWARLSNKKEIPWKIWNQYPASKFILNLYCHKAKLAI